jgi:hypothetical protein
VVKKRNLMFVAAIADLYLKIKTSVIGCFISYPKFRTKTALEKKELNQSIIWTYYLPISVCQIIRSGLCIITCG